MLFQGLVICLPFLRTCSYMMLLRVVETGESSQSLAKQLVLGTSCNLHLLLSLRAQRGKKSNYYDVICDS